MLNLVDVYWIEGGKKEPERLNGKLIEGFGWWLRKWKEGCLGAWMD